MPSTYQQMLWALPVAGGFLPDPTQVSLTSGKVNNVSSPPWALRKPDNRDPQGSLDLVEPPGEVGGTLT